MLDTTSRLRPPRACCRSGPTRRRRGLAAPGQGRVPAVTAAPPLPDRRAGCPAGARRRVAFRNAAGAALRNAGRCRTSQRGRSRRRDSARRQVGASALHRAPATAASGPPRHRMPASVNPAWRSASSASRRRQALGAGSRRVRGPLRDERPPRSGRPRGSHQGARRVPRRPVAGVAAVSAGRQPFGEARQRASGMWSALTKHAAGAQDVTDSAYSSRGARPAASAGPWR